MKIVGKIINVADEAILVGNIEEGDVGSVCLSVLATFEYNSYNMIILCDSNGVPFGFTYIEENDLMILASIKNKELENVVCYVMSSFLSNDIDERDN